VKRGDLYRVFKVNPNDPKNLRVFVIVSRQVLLDSKFSTAICAPVHSVFDGLSTQVSVGIAEGLKHDSAIFCDELVSIPKTALTDFIGRLGYEKNGELNKALGIAVGVG
jgi:mRNA interferase MazF